MSSARSASRALCTHFFEYMRTSPKFQPKSETELEQGYHRDQAHGRGEGAALFLASAQERRS